ncbi:hypothetical protein PR202_gb06717 [Eleusine coracana subsp. coracana]|uniref:Uncharacterized protein n=1 Tax=Eleusine coracana subsp. coracana TaxID=191504 RepID=A0AAV5E7U7_ELECO|nr:hypothetical protein PR202_gb06717 [Eleusine coracana subsp. coracana]
MSGLLFSSEAYIYSKPPYLLHTELSGQEQKSMTRAHSNSCLKQFWDGVQDKRNNSNFTIELLPSLGATINHSNKLQKFTISPYDPRYRCWELFLTVLVVYSAWICPLELAFLRDLPSKLLLVENIANGFFAIDIVLTFFVAYVDSKTHILVDDRKRIAVRLEKDIRFNYFWIRCSKLISQKRTLNTSLMMQRDSIQAASEFAARNQLPEKIKRQILSHFCLQFKTEGLNQQDMLNSLPKGIRSSIAYSLFFPIMRQAYLFDGVSNNFITELVTEVQAEYFPPEEDIMLQNEGAADIYLVVSGAVNMITTVNGDEQKLKQQGSLPDWNQPAPRFMAKYELFCVPQEAWLLPQIYLQYTKQNCDDFSEKVPTLEGDNGSTKLASDTIHQTMPLHKNSDDEPNSNYGTTYEMEDNEEDRDAIHMNCETKTNTQEICIQIKPEHCSATSNWQTSHETEQLLGSSQNTSEGTTRSKNEYYCYEKWATKRVTIHANYPHNATGYFVQNGKLINLPGSLEELFEIGQIYNIFLNIAGKKFPGFHPTKLVSRDNAEIDDIGVIRDGDHLFLLQM